MRRLILQTGISLDHWPHRDDALRCGENVKDQPPGLLRAGVFLSRIMS
jgi:hypothetical protein